MALCWDSLFHCFFFLIDILGNFYIVWSIVASNAEWIVSTWINKIHSTSVLALDKVGISSILKLCLTPKGKFLIIIWGLNSISRLRTGSFRLLYEWTLIVFLINVLFWMKLELLEVIDISCWNFNIFIDSMALIIYSKWVFIGIFNGI